MIDTETDRRRPAAWRRNAPVIGLGLVGLGLAGLWSLRAPIATELIDGEFRKRGVDARYAIEHLGPGGAILSNLSIGDPASPDFTADRISVEIGWNWNGARIKGIGLDGAWLRGRLTDKGLSFGAVDRLRPTPTGQPFSLPDLDIGMGPARLTLVTPPGTIGLAAEGAGNLTRDFQGRVAISAPRLALDKCGLQDGHSLLSIAILDRTIGLEGPAVFGSAICEQGQSGLVTATIKATLPETLTAAKGRIELSAQLPRMNGGPVAAMAATSGDFSYSDGAQGFTYGGATRVEQIEAPETWRKQIRSTAAALDGTPLGPLAKTAGYALSRASIAADGSGQISLRVGKNKGHVTLSNLGIFSESGVRLTSIGRTATVAWPQGDLRMDGELTLSGGGLPTARINLKPTGRGSWHADARVEPYEAGGARLAFGPISFDWAGSSGHLVTGAALDGPVAGGFVRALTLPIDARFSSDGSFALGKPGGCLAIGFTSFAFSGVNAGSTQIPLCASPGGPLLRLDPNGRLAGSAQLGGLSLKGTMNGQPLVLDVPSGRIALSGQSSAPQLDFGLNQAAIKLRQESGDTNLRFANLTGSGNPSSLRGRMGGAGGNLAGVPLLVDQGTGDWNFSNGVLALAPFSARISDAAPSPRFEPVLAKDGRITLKNGVITGNSALHHPDSARRVGHVELTHDLSSARGNATIRANDLNFDADLQPDMLTALSRGVVANVRGPVEGEGHIRWSPRGVTSDGTFETEGMDLAAAFGSVTQLKGRIVFDDLLAMTTAPGQTVTVAEINPGVSATNGVIRYQLLPGQQVKIESGEWPFAGGELRLEPTVLNFGKPSERHFTLTVSGLDAAQFIQQFNFKNFAVTGIFDGSLPLVFDETGGRIEGGRLVARPEGGTLAYVGEISEADLGGAGKLAFDALKSLKYKTLAIDMDGRLDGEIISKVSFNGINQAPVNPSGGPLPISATGFPFKFNITVRAPFRALLSTAESFSDVRARVRQAMPNDAGTIPGAAPVQPSDSENK